MLRRQGNSDHMSSDTSAIDKEMTMLCRMIEALPKDVSVMLSNQLSVVIRIMDARNTAIRDHVFEQLDDIRLSIKTMQFDLESTKSEKQVLEEKLRGAGLD